MIQGSNMAECHPVGFQWVMEAKAKGATIIHVDPRFTRTSAVSDIHAAIRAGTDIAFLGALVNHVLSNDLYFREYVVAYTNAASIIGEEFRDTEDLDGLFSGWDPEAGSYDVEFLAVRRAATRRSRRRGRASRDGRFRRPTGSRQADARRDPATPTLRLPGSQTALQPLHARDGGNGLRHLPAAVRTRSPTRSPRNSGRDRTTALCYAVGWTHHANGVQVIRTGAILQLLLGNIGRPGGGIMALRGHASIQGSTDIPTLYNLLPGYIPMPHADTHQDLDSFVAVDDGIAGFWGNMRSYVVSLLKSYWGDVATVENDFCFDYLPRLTGDHSTNPTVVGQLEGAVKGYFLVGENPAVGTSNGKLQRLGLASLDWLVVRDLVMIESATFWKDGPEIETGEMKTAEIGTEVFFLPAAAHTEKSGTFTNTQRMLQWHHKAVEPPGEAQSDLMFYYELGRRIRSRLRGSSDERDRPLLDLAWDYPVDGPAESRAPKPCCVR